VAPRKLPTVGKSVVENVDDCVDLLHKDLKDNKDARQALTKYVMKGKAFWQMYCGAHAADPKEGPR